MPVCVSVPSVGSMVAFTGVPSTSTPVTANSGVGTTVFPSALMFSRNRAVRWLKVSADEGVRVRVAGPAKRKSAAANAASVSCREMLSGEDAEGSASE